MSAIDLLTCAQPAGSALRRGVAAGATHLRGNVRNAPLPLPITVAASAWLTLVIHVAGGQVH